MVQTEIEMEFMRDLIQCHLASPRSQPDHHIIACWRNHWKRFFYRASCWQSGFFDAAAFARAPARYFQSSG
jgi:hypothetical protein